jgi:hypothetical protein
MTQPRRFDSPLSDGASTARRIASETLREVRERMGFLARIRSVAVEL